MVATLIFENTATARQRMLCAMRIPLALLLAAAVFPHAPGQTADRSAAPPSPATTAPEASASSYSLQNGELVVAPGLKIPNGNVPWALDTVNTRQVLVPIHHALLRTDATPTARLEEGAASSPLHSAQPVFFVHASDRTENSGDSGRGTPTGWALLPVVMKDGRRTLDRPKFSEVNGATVCSTPVICLAAETLPDGWLRMTPKSPLAPGEYALLPVPRTTPANGTLLAYHFTVDTDHPTAKDAVSPGENLETHRKKHRGSVQ